MKKIIITILFTIQLTGCYYILDPLADVEIGEMTDYYFNCPLETFFLSIKNVYWLASCVPSKKDERGHDYWQLPEETYKLNTGDCEDKAILLMYYAHRLGIDMKLVMVEDIFTGGDHALTMCTSDGKFYDPALKYISDKVKCNYRIKHIIPYNETIWMTYYYHRCVGKYLY